MATSSEAKSTFYIESPEVVENGGPRLKKHSEEGKVREKERSQSLEKTENHGLEKSEGSSRGEASVAVPTGG